MVRSVGAVVAGPAIPQWQFQVAMVLGLFAFAAAWQRAMRPISGYMPLAAAYRCLIRGFITGAMSAAAFDNLILRPMILAAPGGGAALSWQAAVSMILLLGMAESSLVLWLIARSERRENGSAPSAGHAYGVGAGSMLGAYLAVRIFDPNIKAAGALISGFGPVTLVFAFLLALAGCSGLGAIGSHQGARLLVGARGRPLIESAAVRTAIRSGLAFGVFLPIVLLAMIPAIAWMEIRARSDWVQRGLTPLARRLQRRAARGHPVSSHDSSRDEEAE